MGRTIPSFRTVLEIEKEEWKPFRNALDKSERKNFDDMWDIPRLYASACSNSVQLVPLHPIIISILFHHYRELKECKSEVERIGTKVYIRNKELIIKEEEEQKEKKNNNNDKGPMDRNIFIILRLLFVFVLFSSFSPKKRIKN